MFKPGKRVLSWALIAAMTFSSVHLPSAVGAEELATQDIAETMTAGTSGGSVDENETSGSVADATGSDAETDTTSASDPQATALVGDEDTVESSTAAESVATDEGSVGVAEEESLVPLGRNSRQGEENVEKGPAFIRFTLYGDSYLANWKMKTTADNGNLSIIKTYNDPVEWVTC